MVLNIVATICILIVGVFLTLHIVDMILDMYWDYKDRRDKK